MESNNRQLLHSGIEPVDTLLGGLESGNLYLVHGEAAGKSLFGIKFLIEGLKRGENAALVIRYSPEDAVRRFARLGYDCLEDIYSGRLVILEYSDEIVQQIARLRSITPVLRELEWLLGETRPRRLVLDPVASLVIDEHGNLQPRVKEFSTWALSFGATTVLVAEGENRELIDSFKPLVEESFRFEVSETAERATRLLVFEKSQVITPKPIEVDPSRGVFLLGRSQQGRADAKTQQPTPPPDVMREIEPLAPAQEELKQALVERIEPDHSDIFSSLLEELNLNELELAPPDDQAGLASKSGSPSAPPPQAPTPDEARARSVERRGASGSAIDHTIAARALDILLRPPDFEHDSSAVPEPTDLTIASLTASQSINASPIDPKDFNVLVIDDDQAECEFIAQALSEYRLETVHDGVAGLAKLISFKPDLVVLDVDLPIIDGFKVLAHIRSSLNMPIIIVSGSRVRASDRMLSAELGADYYLTKPYNVKELRHKARQLIARYHGISSWIVNSPGEAGRNHTPPAETAQPQSEADAHRFLPYNEFTAQVEKRIHVALDKGPSFSVVGCRLPDMTASGGQSAIRLYDLVHALIRETDLVSTNSRNDLVILLAEADTQGARSFVARLRARVMEEMGQSLMVWMRSFPELEESGDSPPSKKREPGSALNRRATDRQNAGDTTPAQGPLDSSPGDITAQKAAATRSQNVE